MSSSKKLQPISCNLNIIKYEENYGSIHVPKVAITILDDEKEAMNIINQELNSDCVITMYEDQYNAIFAPLFKSIGETNILIRKLSSMFTPD